MNIANIIAFQVQRLRDEDSQVMVHNSIGERPQTVKLTMDEARLLDA